MLKRNLIIITTIGLGIAVAFVVVMRTTYDSSFLSPTSFFPASTLPLIRAATEDPTSVDTISSLTSVTNEAHATVPPTLFRIAIPSIGVNATVEDVGVKDSTGNIATPRKLADAGWYTGDAVPGASGTAVILGHVDNGLGFSGVFHDLKNLQPGDEITVTNKDGSEVRFAVTSVVNYVLATAPVHDILHDPNYPVALHLITCDKSFYGGRFHYDNRVVVTAIPV
jgi:sortase (surface protein transpeptidase)